MRNLKEINAKEYGIIYKATNLVNGKSYIGQTTKSLQIRKAAHIRDHTNRNYSHFVFYRALSKYGIDNFKWEVIDYAASDEELNNKEIHWIKHYNSNGKNGYNMTAGGQGVKNYKVTEEGVQRRIDVFNRMWSNGHADTILKGEDHPRALLTNNQVKEIVNHLINRSLNIEELSEKYNTHKSNIISIKNRSSYKYIISNEDLKSMNEWRQGENKKVKEITKRDVLEMKDLLLYTRIPSLEIYSIYNITHGQFSTILYNSKYSDLFTEEEASFTRNRKQAQMLTIEEVIEIKEMLQEELYSQKEIAMILNVPKKSVGQISRGERWGNILIDLPMEDIEIYDWKPIEIKPRKPNRKNQN